LDIRERKRQLEKQAERLPVVTPLSIKLKPSLAGCQRWKLL
jgi:hypothetical protein